MGRAPVNRPAAPSNSREGPLQKRRRACRGARDRSRLDAPGSAGVGCGGNGCRSPRDRRFIWRMAGGASGNEAKSRVFHGSRCGATGVQRDYAKFASFTQGCGVSRWAPVGFGGGKPHRIRGVPRDRAAADAGTAFAYRVGQRTFARTVRRGKRWQMNNDSWCRTRTQAARP